MKMRNPILRHLNLFDRSQEIEREIEEELRFHLEMRARDNIEAGMTPAEAEVQALRRFGDYDNVKATCREITKERLECPMTSKSIKGIIWAMLGCGLTLTITGVVPTVMNVGHMMIYIAIMWRLLLYLRSTEPDQRRIRSAQQTMLNIPGLDLNLDLKASDGDLNERPFKLVPAYDQRGRTPVERLISEDE